MKPLILICLFIAHFSIFAEGYKAPSLKVPKSSPKKSKVKAASLYDQNSFKVEEEFEANRDLASDEEMKLKWSDSYEKDKKDPMKEKKSDERIIPWKMLD